jgi:hypothetical protein
MIIFDWACGPEDLALLGDLSFAYLQTGKYFNIFSKKSQQKLTTNEPESARIF